MLPSGNAEEEGQEEARQAACLRQEVEPAGDPEPHVQAEEGQEAQEDRKVRRNYLLKYHHLSGSEGYFIFLFVFFLFKFPALVRPLTGNEMAWPIADEGMHQLTQSLMM